MDSLTQEQRRILNFMASAGPYANTTVTAEDLRAIMLSCGGNIMTRGRLWDLKSKHLGAGVYKLTIAETNR
jgi:hypothetical protein